MSDRPLRLCDLCGQLDDHPRHVIDGVEGGTVSKDFLKSLPEGLPATAIAEAITENVKVRHIDCCAATGCPVCIVTEQATAGARGKKLIALVEDGATRDLEVPDIPKEFTHG